MFLVTIFHLYRKFIARRLHRIWPRHFVSTGAVTFLPGLVLKATAIKYAPAEPQTLRYIRQHTTIPVPKVYASARGYGRQYFLMEQVEGDGLDYAWPSLNDEQRDAIVTQLHDYITQLRSLPSPYGKQVCAVDGGGFRDTRISSSSGLMGPFENEAEFNDYLVEKAETFLFPESLAEIRSRMRDDHRIFFTHGDLAPRNIMVKDGRISAIVDWGESGWFPEHWELVKAMWYPDLDDEWDKRVLRLFDDEDKRDWNVDKEMTDHFFGCF